MKIICVGRNYVAHAAELNNAIPEKPVIFLKPDTALLQQNKSFFIPDFTKEVHHEIEMVYKICKEGKHIAKKFANRYYDAVTVGIDFTARDIQQQQKEKGLPWEIAKAFDHSAAIGEFVSFDQAAHSKATINLTINGESRQHGCIADTLFHIDDIIAYISAIITLRKGDLIFTGTPSGVSAVKKGDRLQGYLNGECLFDFLVK
ncbi:MAG: hypothetical protein RIQ89_738 [Bacteroidota bacterium]|jgi:2-keto-4-pentenoate hydratase/2-oxohepta-3-ene-1,7-dioic acid hydratase in catechol pathway